MDDHIGEVFQDEDNMAAILLRRHLETGDLMMVSKFDLNYKLKLLFFLFFVLNSIVN